MKYQEKYLGSREDFFGFIKENLSKLVRGNLEVEGERVTLPGDKELVYKIKYEEDEYEGSYAIKISWVNKEEVEVEEEEEEEEEIEF